MDPRTSFRLAGLALPALLLGAVVGGAQESEQTVRIPSSETEDRRMQVEAGIGFCETFQGAERSECLARLSRAAEDATPCDRDPSGECSRTAARESMGGCRDLPTKAERAKCQLAVAVRYAEPDSCEEAAARDFCLVQVASERRDPEILRGRISDPKARDVALASYASMSGDVSVVDEIGDSYKADFATISARVNEAARTGERLDNSFCWEMRGEYAEVDGYVEDVMATYALCQKSVRTVNEINERLNNADSPEAKEALRQEIAQTLKRLQEREDEEIPIEGDVDDRELELEREIAEAAGLELDEAEVEARVARQLAERSRQSCDFAEASAHAEELRAAVARIAETRETRVSDPWLRLHYDTVREAAEREPRFEAAWGLAMENFLEASAYAQLAKEDPSYRDEARARLDAVELFARRARPDATPGCGEERDVDRLLAEIDQWRDAIRRTETGALPEEAEKDSEDGWGQGGFTDARQSDGEDWGDGRLEVEEDPCRGPRPEYVAAVRQIQQAVQKGDRAGVDAAVAELPSGCPGDADWLRRLAQAVRDDGKVAADQNLGRLMGASERARAKRSSTFGRWSRTLSTLADLERRARTFDDGGRGGSGRGGGQRSGRATGQGGSAERRAPVDSSAGSAGGGCIFRIDASANALGRQEGIRWYLITSDGPPLTVSVLPIPEGRAAPRGGGGTTVSRPYSSLEEARRAGREKCR